MHQIFFSLCFEDSQCAIKGELAKQTLSGLGSCEFLLSSVLFPSVLHGGLSKAKCLRLDASPARRDESDNPSRSVRGRARAEGGGESNRIERESFRGLGAQLADALRLSHAEGIG